MPQPRCLNRNRNSGSPTPSPFAPSAITRSTISCPALSHRCSSASRETETPISSKAIKAHQITWLMVPESIASANPIFSRNGPSFFITLSNPFPTTIPPVHSHQNPSLLQSRFSQKISSSATKS
ncbi:hypothetical protein PtA15_3A787 [Puccinia triticina]|uniref:Uncharacterized protein n=1 Tax=Puccinia triticina TaxID=208348 RepID=A0ABY7CHI1_9BASI|nr:uncharacterized protein PtA15_3A787 [Puccinia triticina]WAQ83417.1 hypothetical protein PtA15_3A787 [Puccinia triticina]